MIKTLLRLQTTAAWAIALVYVLAAGLPADASAQSIRELFDRTKASVVVVHTESRQLVTAGGERGFVSAGGLGSGVYVGERHVVTASHVVETAEKVTVEFSGGQTVNARVVSSEPFGDVALLEIEWVPSSAVEAPLGDSDLVGVGDEIYVVGAPYGLSYSLTVGHISSRQQPGDQGQRTHPDRAFPDRCCHKHRKLRRPDVQYERRGHRYRELHPQQVGWF